MFGCKLPKVDIRDYKVDSKRAGVLDYPATFELSHPRIKNQFMVNSCCAHASSSVLEYYAGGKYNLSTDFIYGMDRYVNNDTEQGMYLVDACKIIKQYGDMLEEDCTGNTEVPNCFNKVEKLLTDEEKLKRAYEFGVSSYYACNTDNDIKYALMTYGPVLAGVDWYKDSVGKDGVINFNKKSPQGYHAVMIYGWNETGWLVQNSWGKTWGKDGCFVLPYADGPREARIMIDEENEINIDGLVKPKTLTWIQIIVKVINFIINIFVKK